MFLMHFSVKSNMLTLITAKDDAPQWNNYTTKLLHLSCRMVTFWRTTDLSVYLFYYKAAKPELMMPEQFILHFNINLDLQIWFLLIWMLQRETFTPEWWTFFKQFFFFPNNKIRIDNMHYIALTNFLNICFIILNLSHQDN